MRNSILPGVFSGVDQEAFLLQRRSRQVDSENVSFGDIADVNDPRRRFRVPSRDQLVWEAVCAQRVRRGWQREVLWEWSENEAWEDWKIRIRERFRYNLDG
jgi:hypothetical protein